LQALVEIFPLALQICYSQAQQPSWTSKKA
jgi:hypothetical protein